MCILASRYVAQVSPIPNVAQDQLAGQQGDCGYSGSTLPLVIDLEDSSDTPDVVASTSAPSTSLILTVEQPLQHLNTTEIPVQLVNISDHASVSESTVTREVTAVTDSESATAVDLTVAKQRRLIATEASVSNQSCSTLDSATSADVLSEEYKKRYEKYENLCMLITVKDRELTELNDERKRLHQLLVDLQRSILARPVDTTATATAAAAVAIDDGPPTAPPNSTEAVADEDREKERDESAQGKAAATTVAYRRRPAHRGVTSVRVMVKSTQPPTAHSTKINLSRYNSLFCNYDDATGHRKRPTDVAVANEDVESGIHATDLTSGGSERTARYDGSSEEVVQPSASTMASEELCRDLDGAIFLHRTKAERRSGDIDAGYARRVVGDASPTSQGVVQYQRRPDDVGQTCRMSVLESYPIRHEIAAQNTTVGHDGGPSGAQIVPEDGQRAARQITDAARHQQFVIAATNETVLSTARTKRDMDDQRSVVMSTMRPELSLVLSSSDKYHSAGAGAEVEVSPRSVYQRRELRPPPPPYPHRRSDLPQTYAAMAAPGLSPLEQTAGLQSSRIQLDHGAAPTATCAYRKENAAGPRTVYVQPMRADNQATTVIQPGSVCTSKDVDVVVLRQPCSDIPPGGHVVSEAVFLSNRMSPPALPLRTGVRTTYNQRPTDNIHESVGVGQTQYLHHVAADMTQPRPRSIGSYHGNRLSNPQTSRSTLDGAPQQLTYPAPPSTTNAEQRYATMTSSSAARDVINRHEVDRRPLDQLQHFVDVQQRPLPDRLVLDAGDPRLRPPSPGLMTSGHLNNVDGRSHIPTVGVDYSHQDAAAVTLVRAGDCLPITEADFSRRGAYQTGHPSGFVARAGAPPQRYRNPSQAVPPRGPPPSGAVGLAPAPLDMSAVKRRRYSSLNKVIAKICPLSRLNRHA